jgi:hypothetical protein
VNTVTAEHLLSLKQVASRCPRNDSGMPPTTVSIKRWIKAGVVLRDNSRVYLKATRFPYGWRIAPEDFDSFLQRLTADFSRP